MLARIGPRPRGGACGNRLMRRRYSTRALSHHRRYATLFTWVKASSSPHRTGISVRIGNPANKEGRSWGVDEDVGLTIWNSLPPSGVLRLRTGRMAGLVVHFQQILAEVAVEVAPDGVDVIGVVLRVVVFDQE